jgi:HK97 gp10 family phage protein
MRKQASIKGDKELLAALQRLGDVASADNLEAAALSGVLIIQNAIIARAPFDTGTYRRGWHTETLEKSATRVEVITGNNIPYGPRLEYGFDGTDSKGRTYHQPAQPHVRPAYDETQAEALQEISDALRALVLNQ